MALTVATNTGALMAQAAASSVNKEMETSMHRLSTGMRINSAADDAAGVAIASRLTSEVKGTNMAIRNAMDAQALIDTAEGAHIEIGDILQRMRELAVQAANDTNSAADRDSMNAEVTELKAEIDRIKDVTTWAGIKLLDGTQSAVGLSFQIGADNNAADTVTVKIDDMGVSSIGSGTATYVTAISLDTMTLASAAISVLDEAITTVNTQRSELGSYSNRLDHVVNNLTNVSTNLQAGLGRIQDADFAAETTSLAKSQILQQASTAMLAQANASKQNVLSLLQG
ncbi:flagellin [Paracoccaceae bacterium]|nr:flagellin [Paracoccaceae bacterium]